MRMPPAGRVRKRTAFLASPRMLIVSIVSAALLPVANAMRSVELSAGRPTAPAMTYEDVAEFLYDVDADPSAIASALDTRAAKLSDVSAHGNGSTPRESNEGSANGHEANVGPARRVSGVAKGLVARNQSLL